MKHQCDQCTTAWDVPENVDWARLKLLRPDWAPVRALEYLRELGISGYDAKAIVGHQCYTSDCCHNCQSKLLGNGVVSCPRCSAMNYNFEAADLYPKILGEAWNGLPASIRWAHELGREKRGCFRVTHGSNAVARQLARWSRLPPQDDSAPVVLQIVRAAVHAENDGERWERHFGDTSGFTTLQWAAGNRLVERFDGWELSFALRVVGETLVYEQHGARLCIGPLRLPMPQSCAPHVYATEESDAPGQVHVRVNVTLPLVGLLIAYDGHLEVGEEAAS